jgi:Flp pilus assembly protein TadB
MSEMSRVEKKRKPFKLQIMDLLIEIGLSSGIADEVAFEVVKNSEEDTPIETIRIMILKSLRKYDAKAAQKLAQRFQYIEKQLEDVRRKAERGDEIYDEQAVIELLKADEITAAELFFMEGRAGRSWQRKTDHRDAGSTELSREEYYED